MFLLTIYCGLEYAHAYSGTRSSTRRVRATQQRDPHGRETHTVERMFSLEDFLDDDGELFPAVGEIEVYRKRLTRYAERGADKTMVQDMRAILQRLENACVLLTRIAGERQAGQG
jgi:hypothetical protein